MCPNATVGGTAEGGEQPGKYSRCFAFRTDGPEGECCEFNRLGKCGG